MKLVVFGAGGMGKEAADLAMLVNHNERKWDEILFQDDVVDEGTVIGLRCFHSATVESLFSKDEREYIIALGEPSSKEKIYSMLKSKDLKFANVIANDAQVSKFAKLGEGIIIKKGSIVQAEAEIGNNVTLQSYMCVGHGARVGDHCQLSTFSVIGGESVVGNRTFISMNCTIREKITIGSNVIVSAGSAVLKSIESDVTVAGNPARVILRNTDETRVFK